MQRLLTTVYFSGQEGVPKCTKIVQFVSTLTNKVFSWVTTDWSQGCEHSPKGKEIGERLLSLKQRILNAAEFALSFQTLAAANLWNELAHKAAYHEGLNTDILTYLVCRTDQDTLDLSTCLFVSASCLELRRNKSPCHPDS